MDNLNSELVLKDRALTETKQQVSARETEVRELTSQVDVM